MKVLITCPPMLGMIDAFRPLFEKCGVEITCPKIIQTLTVEELIDLVPAHDGWIVGDDPATRAVFQAGKKGRLKAVVKWGIGVDNVDFEAARDFGIPITNTPNMFGKEVADIAMAYVTALAREIFLIDRKIRRGGWPKPCGISIADKIVALVGFGDIGRNTAKRLLAADMRVIAYDPFYKPAPGLEGVECSRWPDRLADADFIVFTCSLTPTSKHMLNSETLVKTKKGVRVVNVARGPLIDEEALIAALKSGQVHSAALDVFETEPLKKDSYLRKHERCVFGSHNSSNTSDAVLKTSRRCVSYLFKFLGINEYE